jgi:hypothetical protein
MMHAAVHPHEPTQAGPESPERDRRAAGLLVGVATLLEDHLSRLEQYAQTWDDQERQFIRMSDKVAVESALFVLIASRVRHRVPGLAQRLDDLAALLAPLVRGRRTRDLMLRVPSSAVTLGAGHVFLQQAGYPDSLTEDLFQRALRAGAATMAERTPYRMMDVRWMLGLREAGSPPSLDDVAPLSILGGAAHPLVMASSDFYAFTHAVMYATDFGAAPLPACIDPERLRAGIDAGAACHILSEDFDLLVEMLICAASCRWAWSAHARLAWHVVLDMHERLGFLPTPGFDHTAFSALTGDAAAAHAFRGFYHTNLVFGILCAIILSQYPQAPVPPTLAPRHPDASRLRDAATRGRAAAGPILTRAGASMTRQSSDRPAPATASEALDVILGTALSMQLPSGPEHAPWVAALRDAPQGDAEIAHVLSDAAIVYSGQTGQLVSLARALFQASHRSPSVAFGCDYLLHQQAPDGLFGVSCPGDLLPEELVGAAACTMEVSEYLWLLADGLAPISA